MRRIPPIRSALLGISGATAALLIGFMPSGATAATNAPARQSHPIAATPTIEAPLQTCGMVEQRSGYAWGHAILAPLNVRNGPAAYCPVVGKASKYNPLHYYCSYGGWTYLWDPWHGIRGWATDYALSNGGSKKSCGLFLKHP